MRDVARVVTSIFANTKFVYRHPSKLELTGICADLWNQTASNLNLSSSVEIVHSWWDMFAHFNANKSDVIMERCDEAQMEHNNVTK